MKKITMKEFQNKSNIEIIKELMKSIMQDKGIIKKVFIFMLI